MDVGATLSVYLLPLQTYILGILRLNPKDHSRAVRLPQERLMEQIAGLEPASHAWQARILTICTISANVPGRTDYSRHLLLLHKMLLLSSPSSFTACLAGVNGTLCNH